PPPADRAGRALRRRARGRRDAGGRAGRSARHDRRRVRTLPLATRLSGPDAARTRRDPQGLRASGCALRRARHSRKSVLTTATESPVLTGAEASSAEGAASGPEARQRTGVGVIHGFSGSPVSTRPLAEALAALGFRVEAPRLPGHGTHPRDMARTRYADWR